MTVDNAPGLEAQEVDARGPIRLLVAEDNKLLLHTLESFIDWAGGFQASYTNSAADALRILREAKDSGSPIEAVFSDLGLTDGPRGGFDIADAVRAEGLATHFTLFTGQARTVTPELMQEYGIDLLVDKEVAGMKEIVDALEQGKQAIINPTPRTS